MNTFRTIRRAALRSIALLRSVNGRRTLTAVFLPGPLAVATAAIIVGGFAGGGAGVSNAAGEGSATIAIDAPGAAQPLLTPFTVQANLTSFSGSSTTWGGYDFELAYDPAVLKVDSVTRGLCSSSGWVLASSTPHVVTSCGSQSNRATGTLETITFECLTNDKIVLQLLGRRDAGLTGLGTALFDGSAVDFPMTLTDSSATCGSAPSTTTPTSTPTPNNTPTTTPTATSTIVPPIDSDRDGCPDVKEPLLVPPTDPHNPWDFYSVPVPALFSAPNTLTDFHDNNVSASDAQAVFAYFKKSAKTGSLEYEEDLNGNGIKDGIEYDRSFAGSGKSGPPDGVIGASDAQLAFAQFKLAYHC